MTQELLCDPPRPAVTPPRPKKRDADVIRRGVAATLSSFSRYLGKDYDASEVSDDLSKLLEQAFDWDGYELARTLERKFYWTGSRELIDLCDELASNAENSARATVEEWIAVFRIQPKFSVGQTVRVAGRSPFRGETFEGIISRIDHKRAAYTVRIPTLGHVEEGLGVHGWVLDWEIVEQDND